MAEASDDSKAKQDATSTVPLKAADVKDKANCEEDKQNGDLGSGQKPTVAPSVDTGPKNEISREEHKKPGERETPKWTDHVQAFSAIALVLITGVYTWYAGGQTEAIKDQLNEMRVESTASSNQFKTQLDRLNASIRVEATNAAATQKLANAASTEAGEAKIAALAAQKNADASINNAKAATALASTSEAALTVANRTADETNKLANATATEAAISREAVSQARAALTASQQNFRREQRPYVFFVSHGIVVVASPIKDQLRVTVAIRNFGRSPALRVIATLTMVTGFGSKDQTVRQYFSRPPTSPGFSRSVLPPNAPPEDDNSLTTDTLNLGPAEGPIFMATDKAIYIIGRIDYTDDEGRPHWTDACFYRMANSNVSTCENYNEIDDNEARATTHQP